MILLLGGWTDKFYSGWSFIRPENIQDSQQQNKGKKTGYQRQDVGKTGWSKVMKKVGNAYYSQHLNQRITYNELCIVRCHNMIIV